MKELLSVDSFIDSIDSVDKNTSWSRWIRQVGAARSMWLQLRGRKLQLLEGGYSFWKVDTFSGRRM
jgi:hypothetical protein